MSRHYFGPAIAILLALGIGDATTCLWAQEDPGPPMALRQCGDCHMIFPAQMLPKRSWTAILSRLDDHFGEVASIPPNDLESIRDYLTSHSADSPNAIARDRHYLSEILPDSVPTRITQTAWWNQMHADFDFNGVKHSSIRSPANCLACHQQGVH